MMDNKTAKMITQFLIEEGLALEHVKYIEDRKFSDDAVNDVAKVYALSDSEATKLVSTVKGMREGTAITKVPGRTPWFSGRILTSVSVLSAIALAIVLLLKYTTCNGTSAPTEDTVSQIDAKVSNLQSAVTRLETDKADKTELVKKADKSDLKKLDEKVDLTREKLDADIAKLKEELAKKADKSDLDKLATKRRLRAVEKKLDKLILAHESDEEDEAPVAEADPVEPGTITYILHPVPVDEDE